jgi:carbon monoxide dehydrogenase subunit G
MRTFEFSVFIDRQPQEVFDFMTDPDKDPLWQEGLISSEWITPEPAGVGSRKRTVTRFMGFEIGTEVEFTGWDRPKVYAFKGATGVSSFSGVTKLKARDEGTLVTLAGQVEVSGILKLAEGLLVRQVEKQDRGYYDTLKRVLEAD